MDKEKKSNPNQKQEEVKQTRSETHTPASSTWKRFASKKWFFPAIYLGAAALILALIVWYQASPGDNLAIDGEDLRPDIVGANGDPLGDPVIPVAGQEETFSWPVAQETNATIVMGYYDDQASPEEQAKAVMQMGRDFYPSTGISLAIDGNTSFDVMAAAAGEVVRAEWDTLVGNVVHIKHQNHTTLYQSLEDLTVTVGDQVEQGDVIGKAGRNNVSKDLGVHVHFEVHNAQDEPTNPLAILPAQN